MIREKEDDAFVSIGRGDRTWGPVEGLIFSVKHLGSIWHESSVGDVEIKALASLANLRPRLGLIFSSASCNLAIFVGESSRACGWLVLTPFGNGWLLN